MARKPRFSPGGLAYHVMNRTPGRVELFEDAGDYQAFEKVSIEALDLHRGMRLCAYCLMPTISIWFYGRKPMGSCRASCNGY
jgi:putative transposase